MKHHTPGTSTAAVATLTMIAFASNSLLCRLALQPGLIDAGSFTGIRLLSGAGALIVLASIRKDFAWTTPHWWAAATLFGYAAPFSFAYVRIPVAAGALILFPAVQLTMIGWDVFHGRRPGVLEWSGLVMAMGGLVALMLPGISAPDPIGAGLMTLSGISWGAYSLIGRNNKRPAANTTSNFVYALAFMIPFLALPLEPLHATGNGVFLASISGAVASGLGYILWYTLLPRITPTQAGILQLSAPVLAAMAGVIFLNEPLSLRLVLAGSAIITGVALAAVVPPYLRATKGRKSYAKE